MLPCPKNFRIRGLVTPEPARRAPEPVTSATTSWKDSELPLKPTVFRLARLSPIASMAVPAAWSPERAVTKELNDTKVSLRARLDGTCRGLRILANALG